VSSRFLGSIYQFQAFAAIEHAWNSVQSILAGKELVVDISGITNADPMGIDLLFRMRESGGRLTAALPPESEDFVRSFGIVAVKSSGQRGSARVWRLSRLAQYWRAPKENSAV
jgi:hypothetical protein